MNYGHLARTCRQSSNLSQSKPALAAMPHLDLTHNIPLHSPTPIVGTPFDVNANYEYPFPPDHNSHPSSSVPSIQSPISTSRPPSTCSLHMLSNSPPPHTAKSTSPPPVSSSYTYPRAHPKMRPHEPPVPPGLITKRRRLSAARSGSNDSIQTNSDANEDVSPKTTLSSYPDNALDLRSQMPSYELRGRKKEKGLIGDGSVDLGRSVRINEAEAVDAAAARRNTNTPIRS